MPQTTEPGSTAIPPYAARVTQDPLFVRPEASGLLGQSLSYVMTNHAELLTRARMDESDEEFWEDEDYAWLRPYQVVNGVLRVPVQGALLNRFPYALGRWATGYEYVTRAVARGMDDANVRGIALVIDSFGGEVAGCFECTDGLYSQRRRKPIRAIAADHAFSAAYSIASAADEIAVTRSGGTGSVGVVTVHVDYSEMLSNMGLKVTLIYAGAHKVDGNPYEALPDSVKARIQERIDRLYSTFVSTVARNRGMSEEDVRATEALTYDAEDSISRGFADRVATLNDELAAFEAELAAAGEIRMPPENASTMFTQDQMNAAVAAARQEATAAAVTAERARITAVLSSEPAKARPKAALALALKSDLGADALASVLADLPEEKAEAAAPPAGTGFDRMMDATGNPNVGGAPTGGAPEMSVVDAVFASVGRGHPASRQ